MFNLRIDLSDGKQYTNMIITTGTPKDSGGGNGGGNSTAENQCAITFTQTQVGGGNSPQPLPPSPLLPAGATAGASRNSDRAAGGNGAREGGRIQTPHLWYTWKRSTRKIFKQPRALPQRPSGIEVTRLTTYIHTEAHYENEICG